MQDRIRSWERRASASVVENYLNSIPKGGKVSIFCHDNPDPDALAAGLAMLEMVEKMGLEGSILHGGLIEHQQNRAMVQLLEIPTRRLILDWEVSDIIKESQVVIAVDFHKPGANNILPEECVPNIIIDHHTVEDIGITLGQAFSQAVGDKRGLTRYGHAYVPLDEALSRVVLDLSGRPGLDFGVKFTRDRVGSFDLDLIREFFQGFVNHSLVTLHIDNLKGINSHHQAETVKVNQIKV